MTIFRPRRIPPSNIPYWTKITTKTTTPQLPPRYTQLKIAFDNTTLKVTKFKKKLIQTVLQFPVIKKIHTKKTQKQAIRGRKILDNFFDLKTSSASGLVTLAIKLSDDVIVNWTSWKKEEEKTKPFPSPSWTTFRASLIMMMMMIFFWQPYWRHHPISN